MRHQSTTSGSGQFSDLRLIIGIFLFFAIGLFVPSYAQNTQQAALPVQTNVSAVDVKSIIRDATGSLLYPSAAAMVHNDLYFLGPTSLWWVPDGMSLLSKHRDLYANEITPAGKKIGRLVIQEFSDFVYDAASNSLVILDKSGDVVAYDVQNKSWHIVRANKPIAGLPDPDFVALTKTPSGICLLDPELNEIWNLSLFGALHPYFNEVLPWRIHAGDVNVTNAVGIASDKDIYVIRRNGIVTKYGGFIQGQCWARKLPWSCYLPKDIRPSRVFTGLLCPIYVVERENNRVIAIDKKSGKNSQFVFPSGSDLRGLIALSNGFYAINGAQLIYRSLSSSDHGNCSARTLDHRLVNLNLPVIGVHLPRHPGVWPGARRLYRYGVHQGTDFFADSGRIAMGVHVRAAGSGRVIRADYDFKDMDAQKLAHVMNECYRWHNTSETNEDLFRGCQVWIDHGNGLITKYAHLSKIKNGLRKGALIKAGDVIGYVGVSGTGENLPGRIKHPHLHFEVWLDGHYLGWGLTPAETIGVYEDIFGVSCE